MTSGFARAQTMASALLQSLVPLQGCLFHPPSLAKQANLLCRETATQEVISWVLAALAKAPAMSQQRWGTAGGDSHGLCIARWKVTTRGNGKTMLGHQARSKCSGS